MKYKKWLQILTVFLVSAALIVACSNDPKISNSPNKTESNLATTTTAGNNKPKININEAILSELDKIEAKLGVAGLSNKIQAGRPYAKTEDLVSKKVVTTEQFAQIKDMVGTETVELKGEAKDVDYLTKLGLMKGHMIVAKELLDLQKPEQALPHIGHPVEEIYADVEGQLKERNVKEFKQALMDLQQLVKSKPSDANIAAKYTEALAGIDGAIAALPETQRQNPKLALQVINAILDTAGTEYMAAISDNKIKEVIEYQDSRGFTLYVDQSYQGITPAMTKTYPEVHQQLKANLEKLKSAYPSPLAPEKPVLSVAEMSALIKSNEQAAAKVYAQS
ncbi:MAG: helix-hairpin-helix domain-containing protein [Pseudanabaena sp. ELA607]